MSYLPRYTKQNIQLGGNDMANEARNFMFRVVTKVNVYQLLALSLALSAVIVGMPTGGGGGVG